ncbi:FUSC family protein [Petrocella sp. FN5]|uniref:FUSC family protein n=1 Tax=Petrocella sp. FN5 TaxID=3032002 RepID=UPI0023DA261E|nr:aromatic acid exporter family protein [Petrocella sp. FN5]MDF1617142.1 aromatic acid exporter family protein [Petrocella sp. FN5]
MHIIREYMPGMRTFKTALSVFLCIIIWRIWNTELPFFACIAAVITTQNSIESTKRVGLNRFLGTLIGACVGALIVWFLPNNTLILTLGIIVVIHLTTLVKKGGSAAIACIVYLTIMINIGVESINTYILLRVVETTLGILVATIINTSIRPPDEADA